MKIPRYPGCAPKSPEEVGITDNLPGASSWGGACSAEASSAIMHQQRWATTMGCSAGTQSKDGIGA